MRRISLTLRARHRQPSDIFHPNSKKLVQESEHVNTISTLVLSSKSETAGPLHWQVRPTRVIREGMYLSTPLCTSFQLKLPGTATKELWFWHRGRVTPHRFSSSSLSSQLWMEIILLKFYLTRRALHSLRWHVSDVSTNCNFRHVLRCVDHKRILTN